MCGKNVLAMKPEPVVVYYLFDRWSRCGLEEQSARRGERRVVSGQPAKNNRRFGRRFDELLADNLDRCRYPDPRFRTSHHRGCIGRLTGTRGDSNAGKNGLNGHTRRSRKLAPVSKKSNLPTARSLRDHAVGAAPAAGEHGSGRLRSSQTADICSQPQRAKTIHSLNATKLTL